MLTGLDYSNLYNKCVLTSDSNSIQQLRKIVAVAIAKSNIYQSVSKSTQVPWQVIAAVHFRESNQNFDCQLHNGDPLTARTVHVPKSRPAYGQPPFTWVESATDALTVGRWTPTDWNIPGCLEFIERYNGLGYQRKGINTPYLWDLTNQYTSGLFVKDGTFDPTAKENRPGCVAILKMLASSGAPIVVGRC